MLPASMYGGAMMQFGDAWSRNRRLGDDGAGVAPVAIWKESRCLDRNLLRTIINRLVKFQSKRNRGQHRQQCSCMSRNGYCESRCIARKKRACQFASKPRGTLHNFFSHNRSSVLARIRNTRMQSDGSSDGVSFCCRSGSVKLCSHPSPAPHVENHRGP